MVPSALKGATSGTEVGFPAGDYLLSVALAVPGQGPAIIVDNGLGCVILKNLFYDTNRQIIKNNNNK
jgi:hypothetical protein